MVRQYKSLVITVSLPVQCVTSIIHLHNYDHKSLQLILDFTLIIHFCEVKTFPLTKLAIVLCRKLNIIVALYRVVWPNYTMHLH